MVRPLRSPSFIPATHPDRRRVEWQSRPAPFGRRRLGLDGREHGGTLEWHGARPGLSALTIKKRGSTSITVRDRAYTLYLHLRTAAKKYNRRKGKNSGRGLIPNRVDIDQRPPIVAAKSRIGDWEADTIIGANHKGVVMSHVERTSKYTKLAKLPDKNADSVVQACARVLLPLADQIETITYDNGKEFASHAQIATSLGALSYFAKPYHSWERGLNEHTNGLFRQYFPKGSDFSILSDADVQRVEDKLNSRPRKILGYQTPREIFFSARNLPVALHC